MEPVGELIFFNVHSVRRTSKPSLSNSDVSSSVSCPSSRTFDYSDELQIQESWIQMTTLPRAEELSSQVGSTSRSRVCIDHRQRAEVEFGPSTSSRLPTSWRGRGTPLPAERRLDVAPMRLYDRPNPTQVTTALHPLNIRLGQATLIGTLH